MFRSWIILSLLAVSAEAFVPAKMSTTRTSSSVGSFWRHWIPETDFLGLDNKDEESQQEILENSKTVFLGAALAAVLMLAPQVTLAVSGGGLDYANIDITGQNFSNGNYKGKDFTQVIAKGTNFANSNLQGCRFYKAYLVNTDFTGADVRGAAMEDTSMDGASLKNALAAGSYFGQSLLDVESVENADFTDAQIPTKTLPLLCERPDMKGTNPVTGADTRDSAMCP